MVYIDINECYEETDDCMQLCTNTDGDYNCSCFDGYTGDGNNCTGLSVLVC